MWTNLSLFRLGAVAAIGILTVIPALLPAQRLQPSAFSYLGAFRLPEVTTDTPAVWDWAGQAMTYYPGGDPSGSGDGHPGSLFATGIDTENWVCELTIPAPSLSRDVGALPAGSVIQPFADVSGGLFSGYNEQPRVGMEYLPAGPDRPKARLYLTWGQHFQFDPGVNILPTHACCGLDLDHPDTRGPWWVGTQAENYAGFSYRTNDYLFAIPDAWAGAHTGGRGLATGRFKDGGLSGLGPNLLAIGPWLEGDPPAAGAELAYTALIEYSYFGDPAGHRMNGCNLADAWSGGAWVTAGGASAVVFAGTKGSGYSWYGYQTPDGVAPAPLYPEGAPCIYEFEVQCNQPDGVTPCTEADMAPCEGFPDEGNKGWWASRFDAGLLFYDPADLAAVAAGTLEPWQPQPYAFLDIDAHLFLNAAQADVIMDNGKGDQRKNRLGSPAYDRERGLLYVQEIFADEGRPVVHVWRVSAGGSRHTRPVERP